MVSVEYSEAITETLDILNHTRKEDVEKISSKFMEFLNANASKTYKPELDHTKKIKDMQLKSKTKAILAIIYKKFWCNSEQQEQFNRVLKENENKYLVRVTSAAGFIPSVFQFLDSAFEKLLVLLFHVVD